MLIGVSRNWLPRFNLDFEPIANWCHFDGSENTFINPRSPWQKETSSPSNYACEMISLTHTSSSRRSRLGRSSRTGDKNTITREPTAHFVGSSRSSSPRPG